LPKFLLKITTFVALIVLSIYVVIFIINRDDVNVAFVAAIADKHQYAQSIHEPKIILVGGSNLAFGIASDSIEKALKKPVVNFGLYAGFGLTFVLKEALSEVKKGDVIVLCPEYYLRKPGDNFSKQMAVFAYPPADDFIEYDNFIDRLAIKGEFYSRYARNLIFLPNRIKSPSINDTISGYFRKGFNRNGDALSHLNNPPVQPLGDLFDIKDKDYSLEIQDINQFINVIRQKKANVFWYYPSFSQVGYDKNKKKLIVYEKLIYDKINCQKINQIKDEIYPVDCFYDTHFHLNATCRLERTNKLIKLLKKEIIIKNE
jgi:hypothetical protein